MDPKILSEVVGKAVEVGIGVLGEYFKVFGALTIPIFGTPVMGHVLGVLLLATVGLLGLQAIRRR